jgi:AcrR family transcriptional regulator
VPKSAAVKNAAHSSQPTAHTTADDVETRERILAAAHRVFIRSGTSKARTADIALEAGVNKALLHYYFATKANLADAVFATAVAQLLPRIFAILGDPARSLAGKVEDVVREQIDFHRERPYLAGYVISELHTEPERLQKIIGARGRPPLGVLAAQLQTEIAAGRMRDISTEMFVVNLMALIVFPFVARPILEILIGIDATRFPAFMEERKQRLPELFLASLRP